MRGEQKEIQMLTFISIGSRLGIVPWERNEKRESERYSAERGASTSSCTHTHTHTHTHNEVMNWLTVLLFSAEALLT